MAVYRRPSPPRLLLVTGMSGAGKSTVLDALEDMGWDIVDNLPADLLDAFVRGGTSGVGRRRHGRPQPRLRRRALCPSSSARSPESRPKSSISIAPGAELIRRYDETRRRHPLAPDRPAEDGIARERKLMAPLLAAPTA